MIGTQRPSLRPSGGASRSSSAGPELASLVAHQEAKLLLKAGQPEEASKALTRATALYRSSGYEEVPAFNDEPFAHHWFAKRLE